MLVWKRYTDGKGTLVDGSDSYHSDVARRVAEGGAARYPGIGKGGEDYDSGIKSIPYISPGINIIRDGASYYFGLGHANVGHLGSFSITYRATIDCEKQEARIRIRAYNVWSIESLLRNPVTREPLVDGPDVPKIPIVIDIDETYPLR
jgi:hypothetical protein